jgi:hypothetical protein
MRRRGGDKALIIDYLLLITDYCPVFTGIQDPETRIRVFVAMSQFEKTNPIVADENERKYSA